MRAAAEVAGAVGLAVALHLGAFAWAPQVPGAVASGEGGQQPASLEAADARLAALVDSWERPPVTAPVVPDLALTAPSPAMPGLSIPGIAPAPVLAPAPAPLPNLPPDTLAPAPAPLPAAPPPPPIPAAPTREAKPKPKPEPATAARPAQKAAGSGGGAQAGAGGGAQASLSKAQVSDLRSRWGAAIKARVERRKAYPAAAHGATGSATVRLTVAASGALLGVSIATSSGHAALDQAAVQAVQAAAPFDAAPQGVPAGNQTFALRLRFQR